MATQIEPTRTGGFVLSLLPGYQSRRNVTVGAGPDLAAGTVMGKLTATGEHVPFAPAAADGSQNPVAILLAAAPARTGPTLVAAIVGTSEVNGNLLVWPDGITTPQRTSAVAALAALKILVRL